MALNKQELTDGLKTSLKDALNAARGMTFEEGADPQVMMDTIHDTIATKFAQIAADAIHDYLSKGEVNLTKNLDVSINSGQSIAGQVTNTQVTGEVSTTGTGTVLKDQNNIGKLV